MPNCTGQQMLFGRLGRCEIEANFEGGALSSDGGLMLVRQVDRRIGLSKAVAEALHDPRNPERITHELRDLVAQRLYGLCCGYEDLNDHGQLRQDPLMQTAVGTTAELASSPTLCRLETRATRGDVVALNRVLVEQFISSHRIAPKELILDVDASDIPLHGEQEKAEFHAYYDHYCYLPLYVFAGQAMLACVLRRSRIDGAKHVSAVIKLLVTRLREAWPEVRIIVRGDSGFCRQRLIRWCERRNVGYVIGVARNSRLQRMVEGWEWLLTARHRAGRDRPGARHDRNDPHEAAQDRRRRAPQYPPRAHPVCFASPDARHLLDCRASARPIAQPECGPDTLMLRGLGAVRPNFASLPISCATIPANICNILFASAPSLSKTGW